MALTLGAGGQLIALGLRRSSGSRALDTAALSAVRAAAPFPRPPAALTAPSYDLTLTMTFRR